MVLTFSHGTKSIGEVPFPAVTICPLSKFQKQKFNYTKVYRGMLKLDGNQSNVVTEEEYDTIPVEQNRQMCTD